MPPGPVCSDKPGGRAARSLDDEPTRIYVPLLMHAWIMILRSAAHACVDYASVLCERLLPPRCRSYALYARTLLLVDWHDHLHAVVTSSLATVPGANVFQTDGALAHPLSPLAVRPWCRGER